MAPESAYSIEYESGVWSWLTHTRGPRPTGFTMLNVPESFDDYGDFLIEISFTLRFISRLQKLKLISFYQNFKIDLWIPFDPNGDKVKIFFCIIHHIRISLQFSTRWRSYRVQIMKTFLRFFSFWLTDSISPDNESTRCVSAEIPNFPKFEVIFSSRFESDLIF